MTNGNFPVVAMFLLSCSAAAVGFEELGFLPWGLINTCKFRRSINSNICCSDLHCPRHSCCELYFIYGGYTVQGHCVPRDPNTLLCTRRRNCRTYEDCGLGECCRLAWKGHGLGVCDRLGHRGDVCTRKPVYVHRMPLLCPCVAGLDCVGPGHYHVKGRCMAPRPPTTPIPTPTTTTTTASPTTTEDPCAKCPDPTFFCCLNSVCRIRPSAGQDCGANTCPCRDSTCSDPTSPDNTGHCVAPATTAPMSTTTVTKTTTVKTTTATEPSTETTAEPTTEPATTTTVGDPTTEATTAEPTTTTAMAEPTTTTGDPTTASASTTTTTPGPCPGCPGAPYFCCLNKACRIRPALGQACGSYSCPCRDSTCSDPSSPENNGQCVASTTPTGTTTTTTTAASTTISVTSPGSTTTSMPWTTSLTTTTTTARPSTTQVLATTPDPCARCTNHVYLCCLNKMCRIRPRLGQDCGVHSCPCRDSTCTDPTSPENKGTCQ